VFVRRIAPGCVLALALVFSGVASVAPVEAAAPKAPTTAAQPLATAVWVTITPVSQSHPHGQPSTWTIKWGGGVPPYTLYWQYGDGNNQNWNVGYTTSKTLSYLFDTCTGGNFSQFAGVTDSQGSNWGAESSAVQGGGGPCVISVAAVPKK
jgi:hypothetical protein